MHSSPGSWWPSAQSRAGAAVDVLRPALPLGRLGYELLMMTAGTLLIAMSARVAIPVGFSPVPITGQTFAVLLVGALFGARRGAATVALYLAEGAAGLPVFAGGFAGAAWLVGPTGGYLLGFVPAAFVVGWLAQRGWDRNVMSTMVAMTLGTAVIFACGLAWLGRFVEPDLLMPTGLLPFVPGAIVKIAMAAVLLPVGWRLMRR